MAKKVVSEVTTESLLKGLQKVNPMAEKINKSEYAKISTYISTGNLGLNGILTGSIFKGIPSGRITCIAGESSTGKSFLALNIARESQKLGYIVYYFDTENAIKAPDYDDNDVMIDGGDAGRLGCDLERFVHIPCGTIENLTHQIAQIVEPCIEAKRAGKSYPKVLIVCDSIGALGTSRSKNNANEGKEAADFTKAKKIHDFFSIFSVDFGELDWPFLFTNHVTDNIGSFFPEKNQKGGSGVKFMPTNIIFLSKSQDKEGDVKVGINVRAKSMKNRLVIPEETIFKIRWDRGMNEFVGLEKYISWENCGVARGSYVEEVIETPVLDESGNPVLVRKKPKIDIVKTGKFEFKADEKAKTFAVESTKSTVPEKKFFTTEVFNQEVLSRINEIVEEKMKLSSVLESTHILDEIEIYETSEDDLEFENE